jgi:hypothetical protein
MAMDNILSAMSSSQLADELELRASRELDKRVLKSVLYVSGECDPTALTEKGLRPSEEEPRNLLMGDDPRLQKMPKQPTLIDFFRYRFAPANHLLQSATHALKSGQSEKIVLACLLHDISVIGFIRMDHGYWGAQLLEPYVDEEISWAIRYHQALRFYPDASVGYAYPELYTKYFGADFKPEAYIEEAYEYARKHKWYMTARMITVNDIYAFNPNAVVHLDDFIDIIGRNFRQPKEGLGFDNSPSAHMWRTIIWPTRSL